MLHLPDIDKADAATLWLGRALGPMAAVAVAVAAAAAANLPGTAPNFISKRLLFKQTLTRTRTFVINGKVEGIWDGNGNGNGNETGAATASCGWR